MAKRGGKITKIICNPNRPIQGFFEGFAAWYHGTVKDRGKERMHKCCLHLVQRLLPPPDLGPPFLPAPNGPSALRYLPQSPPLPSRPKSPLPSFLPLCLFARPPTDRPSGRLLHKVRLPANPPSSPLSLRPNLRKWAADALLHSPFFWSRLHFSFPPSQGTYKWKVVERRKEDPSNFAKNLPENMLEGRSDDTGNYFILR